MLTLGSLVEAFGAWRGYIDAAAAVLCAPEAPARGMGECLILRRWIKLTNWSSVCPAVVDQLCRSRCVRESGREGIVRGEDKEKGRRGGYRIGGGR